MALNSLLSGGGLNPHGSESHVSPPNLTAGTLGSYGTAEVDSAGAITRIANAWNTNVTYPANMPALGSNSTLYISVISNAGNDPTTDDGTNWIPWIDWLKGQIGWKTPVRVATAAALPAYTRSGNTITASANASINSAGIDGITDLALNQRILLKDGAAGADNGIYYISQVGSGAAPFILKRALDADASADFVGSMVVTCQEGTTHADSYFMLTTNGTITLNTTSLTFTKLATAGTSLPAGTDTQTIRNNAGTWEASSVIRNDGTYVGIGQAPNTSNQLSVTAPSGKVGAVLTGASGQIVQSIVGTPGANIAAQQIQSDNNLVLNCISTGSSAGIRLQTNVTPVNATSLGNLLFKGTESGGGNLLNGANIVAQAAGTWDATHSETSLLIQTVPTGGSTTLTARLRVHADGDIHCNAQASALATSATSRFVHLPNCAGAPTGTPANTITGNTPIVFNTTHNTLMAYNSGWVPVNHRVPVALTDGANIATNAALGKEFTVTLGGNRTMDDPTNPINGQMIMYRLKQDGTGSRTITWGSAFRFPTSLPSPTLSTTAARTDRIGFIYNGADSKWDCIAYTIGYA